MSESILTMNFRSPELKDMATRVAGDVCEALGNAMDTFADCFFLYPTLTQEINHAFDQAKHNLPFGDQKIELACAIQQRLLVVLTSYDIKPEDADKLSRMVEDQIILSLEEAFKLEPKIEFNPN